LWENGRRLEGVLDVGDAAPSFALPEVGDAGERSDPWTDGPVVLAFFKTSCPVCRMTAPKLQAMADSGVRVIPVGEDPPKALASFTDETALSVSTLSEGAPYPVSEAYGLQTVPTLVLVDGDGVVRDTAVSWDRDDWNRVAVAAGGAEISYEGDGLPPRRPG